MNWRIVPSDVTAVAVVSDAGGDDTYALRDSLPGGVADFKCGPTVTEFFPLVRTASLLGSGSGCALQCEFEEDFGKTPAGPQHKSNIWPTCNFRVGFMELSKLFQ